MTITTTQRTRRLGLTSSAIAATAVLLLASACGTETDAAQAPSSIGGARAPSTEDQSPADRAECLLNQAKQRDAGTPCPAPTEGPETDQPLYLAPSGRPVPLPGAGD